MISGTVWKGMQVISSGGLVHTAVFKIGVCLSLQLRFWLSYESTFSYVAINFRPVFSFHSELYDTLISDMEMILSNYCCHQLKWIIIINKFNYTIFMFIIGSALKQLKKYLRSYKHNILKVFFLFRICAIKFIINFYLINMTSLTKFLTVYLLQNWKIF